MNPRDFLSDEIEGLMTNKLQPRDFLSKDNTKKESLGESALWAIPRVAEDVYRGGMNFIKDIPGYAEKAGTEIPGLFQTAKEHPGHLLGQAAAGIPELGQKIFNTPHKLIEYGSDRLNLLPKEWGETARMAEMPDRSQGINEIFGEAKYPGEKLARGVTRNLDFIIPGTKAAGLLIPTSNKALAKTIIKKHDALESQAVQGFKDVSQMSKERGIPNVPIKNSLDINKIERFFDKSPESKELLKLAKIGDYEALRKVQSHLFSEGNKSLKSTDITERQKGLKMHQDRNKINKAISDNLTFTGNGDLAEILQSSMQDYKTLKDVYYGKKIPNSIKNLVDKNTRKIPKNITKILKEDSIPINRFKEFHSGLESKSKKLGYQKGLNKALMNALKYGALPATGLAGYEKYLKKSE